MTRSQRQDYLRSKYNFECKCAICTLPENESRKLDEKIVAMTQLNAELEKTVDGLETVKLVNRILQLMEEAGVSSGYVLLNHHELSRLKITLVVEDS
jgi:hypothetical protein